MSKPETYVMIIQESVTASIVKDVITFAMFAGLMYFNHAVLDGSTWVDLAFILFVFMWLVGNSSKRVFKGSVAEAKTKLERIESDEQYRHQSS